MKVVAGLARLALPPAPCSVRRQRSLQPVAAPTWGVIRDLLSPWSAAQGRGMGRRAPPLAVGFQLPPRICVKEVIVGRFLQICGVLGGGVWPGGRGRYV
jgi:hypothetical protein